jgi:tryptophan-rich sensory protein
MKINNYFKFLISLLLPAVAAIAGSAFTTAKIPTWYAELAKPSFAPPNWLFGPVWTTLYILMGIALFLIWKKGFENREVKIAFGIFIVQLVLNTLWSIVFFGLQNPGAAFIEIIILWIAIVATIIVFKKISKPAAWLLAPYLAWVSFASVLNYAIWTLN